MSRELRLYEVLRRCLAQVARPYRDAQLRKSIERRRARHHPCDWRQAGALLTLEAVVSAAHKTGIEIVASGGTLLGAVRDCRFAGRPSDVDIRVLGNDEDALRLLSELSSREIDVGKIRRLTDRFHVPVRFGNRATAVCLRSTAVLLDLEFTSENSNKLPWVDAAGPYVRTNHWTANEAATAHIYGCSIMIPDQWEGYLEQVYGSNWRIPC